MKVTAVILAAGQGTRMRSEMPKVLHRVVGKPMIYYAIQAARLTTSETPVVVVGHGAEEVRRVVEDKVTFAVQEEQLGTAHAVRCAAPLLANRTDLVLVTNADMPLLTVDTLRRLVAAQKAHHNPLTMLTVTLAESHGYGRVIRKEDGSVARIVEEAQATPGELAVKELNAGAYCFKGSWLWPALEQVALSPKGEFYLTDLVELAVSSGQVVRAVSLEDPTEATGVNNRVHLAEVDGLMRRRINSGWMEAGVSMVDPAATYIEPEVQIGPDTVLWPGTFLKGKTSIGPGCSIGPNTVIEDSKVGPKCTILSSHLEGAVLEEEVSMGPFAHLRRGARLCRGVHMGNFGEVKDSTLGPGTKMGHFSYIGNATIGADVNIGAGTITCNYDGERKNPTIIGDRVFIGSDTMLVAPVELGEGSHTGAGAVVTKNVPPGETVVGVPARPIRKKE